jgi:hypothetical protein
MRHGLTVGVLLGAALAVLGGCKASGSASLHAEAGAQARGLSGGEGVDDQGRCNADAPDREVSEYDTSGDGQQDVRKVFKRIGTPPQARLVLICREADLNGDGVKDVVRHYTDEGSPLREEADRNFNGQMDLITYYDAGQIIRQEVDRSGDGRVDTKIYYEGGKPLRAERDQAGRSTDAKWQPDTWEYYEGGRLVRMGQDLTGDGQVDRWDRNRELKDALDAQRRRDEGESDDDADEGADSDDEAIDDD